MSGTDGAGVCGSRQWLRPFLQELAYPRAKDRRKLGFWAQPSTMWLLEPEKGTEELSRNKASGFILLLLLIQVLYCRHLLVLRFIRPIHRNERSRNSSQAWLAPSNPTHLSLLPSQPFPKTSKSKFFPKDNTQVSVPFPEDGGMEKPAQSTARRQCGLTKGQTLAVASKAHHQERQEHAIHQQCEVLGHTGQPSLRRAEGALSSGGTRFQRRAVSPEGAVTEGSWVGTHRPPSPSPPVPGPPAAH